MTNALPIKYYNVLLDYTPYTFLANSLAMKGR